MATLTVNAPELSDLHHTIEEIAEAVQDGHRSGTIRDVTWELTSD